MKRKKIPIHIDELGDAGVSLKFVNMEHAQTDLQKAHRDDHYIFLLQQKGSTSVMIDFNSITLKNSCLFFIKPGQVHHYQNQKSVGWFLAVATKSIEKSCRNYLDELSTQFVLMPDTRKPVIILKLLDKILHSSAASDFNATEVQAYVNAFIAMTCSAFNNKEEKKKSPQIRSEQIANTFKQSLKENIHALKKPGDYAHLLHISTSYLNETLIKTTGFSTSYWIQQELFLEAKRLLYHTELSSKEIAFELGFEDHTYFARLFRKVIGLTPIGFRKAYHDLSN